ncbi:hypothetical protein OIU79_021284 [Salix purpurea]|uniref:Uncharacterized protein n=1 Tax=Salix purpurea TaxID=77065 RepID=A0A9Q0WNZ9_SALPP|nr:hypothetical protein OIU79_021284 [Salix purpurea]
MWILGNPIRIQGSEFSNERAIYIYHMVPYIWTTLCIGNHLRIDHTNPTAAIQSMKEVFHRLLRIVNDFSGTHRAWRKGGLHVRPAAITVRYLRPIKTDDWTDDKVNDCVRLLHDMYVENLPEAQMPLHYKVTRNFS